jgi:two-component system nitrogen regulation response regulator GlnG
MSSVFIVDDEPAICWALRKSLESEAHRVQVFSAAEPLLDLIENQRQSPDVILLDVRLPGLSGLEALGRIQSEHPDLPIIVMTAFGDLQTAVDAIHGRAFEYLTKPFDLEIALQSVRRAIAQRRTKISDTNESTAHQIQNGLILGSSVAMQAIYKQIAIAASVDSTVLIEGDRGTGKGIVAAMIHRFSSRSKEPFLSISSVIDRPSDFESELFGSGASELSTGPLYKTGLIQLASAGTLVVEEIGMVPPSTQLKLLRAIESKTYYPLMTAEAGQLNARLLFTTVHDIDSLAAEGELLEEFRSQLQVYRIALPPLRDRREDIAPMAQAFVANIASAQGSMQISEQALQELERRDWPGNIRELRQTIQRAAMVATGKVIEIEDLPQVQTVGPGNVSSSIKERQLRDATRMWTIEHLKISQASFSRTEMDTVGTLYEDMLAVVEPSLITQTLEEFSGNRAAAAALLGLHRSTLRQKMKRYGIG